MNLSKNIQWCMGSSSRHENHSQNIERCLQYSLMPMNLSCSTQINVGNIMVIKFTKKNFLKL